MNIDGIAAHECIEAIALSRKSGRLGTFTDLDRRGIARIQLNDGTTVLVRSTAIGWAVSFMGITFEESDLLDAARSAMQFRDENRGRALATRVNMDEPIMR